MDQKILWAVNQMPKTDDKNLPIMGLEEIAKARTFHESFPQYTKTPLTKLDHMAAYLGVKEIYLKDESYRFGLNAFKVLGGSFSMARYIAKETGGFHKADSLLDGCLCLLITVTISALYISKLQPYSAQILVKFLVFKYARKIHDDNIVILKFFIIKHTDSLPVLSFMLLYMLLSTPFKGNILKAAFLKTAS